MFVNSVVICRGFDIRRASPVFCTVFLMELEPWLTLTSEVSVVRLWAISYISLKFVDILGWIENVYGR